MPVKKKSGLSLWAFLFLIGSGAAVVFFLVELPLTQFVNEFLRKKFSSELDISGITFDRASASLNGDVKLKNLCLRKAGRICVDEVEFNISLWRLFKGDIDIYSLFIDTLSLDASVLLDKAGTGTAGMEVLYNLVEKVTNGLNFRMNRLTLISSGKQIHFRGLKSKIYSSRAKGISVKSDINRVYAEDLPQINFLKYSAQLRKNDLTVKEISLNWLGGTIKSKIKVDAGMTRLNGEAEFKNLDLNYLTSHKILGTGVLTGSASGSLTVSCNLKNDTAWNADGKIHIDNPGLEKFPFQSDIVIKSFMPELSRLQFRSIDINSISYREGKITLNNISSEAEQFYFEGKGTISEKGDVNLALVCHLGEDYYSSLKQVVRDGIHRNEDGVPTFICQLEGNKTTQHIYLDKVLSKVLKTKFRRLGKKLMGLFKP